MQGLDQKIKSYICMHIQPTSFYTHVTYLNTMAAEITATLYMPKIQT